MRDQLSGGLRHESGGEPGGVMSNLAGLVRTGLPDSLDALGSVMGSGVSRIFLSHSSRDSRAAIALKRWLSEQRPELVNEIFLDIDQETGLRLGMHWGSQLVTSNSRCEYLICLLSQDWLASRECQVEYRTAEGFGKRIVVARLDDTGDGDITSRWQRCDLFAEGDQTMIEVAGGPPVRFNSAALDQVKKAIEGAGVGPENFVWPPSEDPRRAPYRGWEPFEPSDAGVYFGRDTAIAQGLDELRGMRFRLLAQLSGRRSLFVVLGPSGSGKSSFLRAGLVPRLQRDDRRFVMLGILRPEGHALTGEDGLAAAIQCARDALGLSGVALGDIKTACCTDPERVYELLVGLRTAAATRLGAAGRRGEAAPTTGAGGVDQIPTGPAEDKAEQGSAPTLVLPLDQAEELFSADAGEQGDQFLRLIADVLGRMNAVEVGLIVAATIRTDRYEAMQNHPALDGLGTVLFDQLKPMPPAEFRQVITGPAARTGDAGHRLSIAPELLTRLLADAAGGADTLPLLALTLSRLYIDYANTGAITLANYEAMGGMRNVVQTAVDEVLAIDPDRRVEQLQSLRAAFIPWLATINPDNDEAMRRVGRYADLPEPSRELIDAMVDKRLLVRDERDGQVVIEVALESLLRQWDDLAGWLREEAQNLKAADEIERNSTAWAANHQDPAWLLTGTRLTDAESLYRTAGFSARLADAGDYLDASRLAENQRLAREEEQRQAELHHAQERQQTAEAHASTLRRRSRILQAVLAATLIITVLAVVALGMAISSRHQAQARFTEATALRLEAEAAAMLSGDRAGSDIQAFQELLAAQAITDKPDNGVVFDALVKRYSTVKMMNTGSSVDFLAYSPDGHRIATTNQGGLRLWNADTGEQIGDTLKGVNGVAFSSDGHRVAAAAADDNSVRLWNPDTGQLVRTFTGPTRTVVRVAFSPDGHRIAGGSLDGTVRVWNTDTGAPELTLSGHPGGVHGVAFSPDGHHLASGGVDNTVRIWNADTGANEHTITGHTKAIESVAFSPDGATVASGSDDGSLRLWDTGTGSPTQQLSDGEPIFSVAWNPHPGDHDELATADTTGKVKLWSLLGGGHDPLETSVPGRSATIQDVAFDADGDRFAAGGHDGVIHIWSHALAAPVADDIGATHSVAYSPGGQLIASAREDGVFVWDSQTGHAISVGALPGTSGPMETVAFDRTIPLLAAGGADGTVALWSTDTLRPLRSLSGGTGKVNSVAFSSDGHLVGAGGDDKIVRLWDPETGRPDRTLTDPIDAVLAIAFSPAQHLVAAGGVDKSLYIWDTDTGALRRKVTTPAAIQALAFSPDGRRIVTGGADNAVRVWDTDSRRPAMDAMIGHSGEVINVAFRPDGRLIGSVGLEGQVRLWDAATGKPFGSPMGGQGQTIADVDAVSAGDAAFRPDGQQLVAGGALLWLWPAAADPGDLCSRLTANPSHTQWNQWVSPDIGYVKVCRGLPIPN
ncbi:nSTAND1 domain-containing NTPase [Mycobacterium sp.]|uniref:nSTAND1 domain-containing NTPase n=1 Tax=Mycobacterium sp. TaxID=1785 RepID=UPI003F98548B